MYNKEITMVIIKNIKIFKVENIVPTLTLFIYSNSSFLIESFFY